MTTKRITKKVTRRKTVRRVKKDLSLIPVSKATNAYELLDEVKALILAEPKRYNQGTFITREGDSDVAYEAPRGMPACGTVACVAGWIAILKSPKPLTYIEISRFAISVLGVGAVKILDFFGGGALHDYVEGDDIPPVQTPEYAALGAKHIENFQARNEAQLKAKVV